MGESAGKAFREAREARGYTVDEVAARLKLPARYIQALEDDDFAGLPEPTFVRGYVRAYARLLRLDEEAMLASCVRLEIRAPRPLVGPDGNAAPTTRLASASRGPSFRGSQSRIRPHHWIAGAVLGAIAVFWVAGGRQDDPATLPVADAAPAPAVPTVPLPPPTTAVSPAGMTTVDLPLPGAPATQPSGSTAVAPSAIAAGRAAGVAATTPSTTTVAATATNPAQPPAGVPPPAARTAVEAPVPRKGLFLRFSGTSWLEVRDADNVVLHTRIEMPGSEVTLEGKAPFTVTLGEAGNAQAWYNGDRVKADRIASTGVARLIIGRPAR